MASTGQLETQSCAFEGRPIVAVDQLSEFPEHINHDVVVVSMLAKVLPDRSQQMPVAVQLLAARKHSAPSVLDRLIRVRHETDCASRPCVRISSWADRFPNRTWWRSEERRVGQECVRT